MVFRRRQARSTARLGFERILVPVLGGEADEMALRVAAMAASATGQVSLLHVIEVPFNRQLDVEDPGAIAHADEILERAEALVRENEVGVRSSVVQARSAGPAIVDDATELGADLIVMGLRYKKRFGGDWDAGRTVPYVMRNSTAPVWCLRARTEDLATAP
jgi:nucleotide-binding universal stress UspA family protein